MNPQDLLLLMGTEIFKIDASWAEKLTKTRVSFVMTPTVIDFGLWKKVNSFIVFQIFEIQDRGTVPICDLVPLSFVSKI